MELYEHKKIEQKWREKWNAAGVYKTTEDKDKKKFYILDMFPYPSGAGLHVGHPKGYIATDIIARYKKMQGFNVLHPMGWDAFGLPAEQFALKNKIHPAVAAEQNIATFKEQIEKISLNYDWEREFSTTDPEYYKWTQWTFLQMFKKGLVYRSHEPINWCPSCKTGLANEDLEDGACERCDTPIEKKKMPQWVIKITDYADRMLEDLDELDWQENIKQSQRNWIGRSEGAQVKFKVKSSKSKDSLQKIVLMHGKDTDPSQKWYPWLASEMQKENIAFEAPVLMHADDPHMDEWLSQLDDTSSDKNTILIGHSRGGVAILRWLEQQPKDFKVKKVILVATNYAKCDDDHTEKHTHGFYTETGYDFEEIKKHCDDFVVLHSRDDEWVSFDHGEKNTQGLDAKFLTFDDRGHFGRKLKKPEIPELLDLISENSDTSIEVFTTRPDTLFGCTYMVLSPEHDLIETIKDRIVNIDDVIAYQKEAQKKTEIERMAEGKEKSGVKLEGIMATNPANNEEIPVYIADYVLAGYGTGAIMAVPAHDQRDFEFAKKYNIAMRQVIAPYFEVTGPDAPRSDENIVEFDAATAVIKHWQKDLYYVVRFKDGLQGLVGGHVEAGESTKDAILRETREESGYQTPVIDEILFEHAYSRGYKTRKKREELCHDTVYIVSLKDDTRKTIEDHETKEGYWMSAEEILNSDNFFSHHKEMFRHYSEQTTFTDRGTLVNSEEFNGMSSKEAMKQITEKVEGEMTVSYKLRDWVFGRQRYWGEPIPLIHCKKCGVVPVPEEELPLQLPDVENYEPTDTGASPLAGITEWVNTQCPECEGSAKRETDTMPQWAGSSWYYLRYIDPKNDTVLVDPDKEKYWSPVDFYVGGAEHATRHLIYARFWHKFLYDIDVVSYKEPFAKLQTVGLIMAEDGRKMSKRWGNVVNPDDVIERFGADTFRTYEMFMGPFDASVAWSTEGMIGPRKFLERIWKVYFRDGISQETDMSLQKTVHKTIKKVGEDIEDMKYNTAIAAMMILSNELEKSKQISADDLGAFLKILSPFAPHITQELWHQMGNETFLMDEPWPNYDQKYLCDDKIELVVQVNGKVRDKITVAVDASNETVKKEALASIKVQKFLDGKQVKKVIIVPGRLVSVVV